MTSTNHIANKLECIFLHLFVVVLVLLLLLLLDIALAKCQRATIQNKYWLVILRHRVMFCAGHFFSQVSKTTWNVSNCYVNLTNRFLAAARLFRSWYSWRQSVVRTKKWRSGPWDLNVTISASCDCSVAIFTTSLESQESYLALRNLTLQITRDFFRLHSTFARLYNAATSTASRLGPAGLLAIIIIVIIIIQWY